MQRTRVLVRGRFTHATAFTLAAIAVMAGPAACGTRETLGDADTATRPTPAEDVTTFDEASSPLEDQSFVLGLPDMSVLDHDPDRLTSVHSSPRLDGSCPYFDASATPGDAASPGDADATPKRVPQLHRPFATCCPINRGPGVLANVPPSDTVLCTFDSQCSDGTNGRCLGASDPCSNDCSYDECFSDIDCPAHTPCDCRASPLVNDANVCATGSDCRVDSDCGANGYCSPSDCGWGRTTYHCHTLADLCVDDADCVQDGGNHRLCGYDSTAGRWACLQPCKVPAPCPAPP